MKFYNRENELAILKKADELKSKQAIMTMLIGRRRVGKTALVLEEFSSDTKLYFFVSKKNEALLCEEFSEEISQKMGVTLFGKMSKFEEIFAYLLELGKKQPFTLIVDEFQEFYKINSSIYSSIQKLWDLHKKQSQIHFIACGSIYYLMKKIYEDNKEPLFGRADFKIDLKPLKLSVLKKILQDHHTYSNENLLDFYTLTGGVAKNIELFVLYDSLDKTQLNGGMILAAVDFGFGGQKHHIYIEGGYKNWKNSEFVDESTLTDSRHFGMRQAFYSYTNNGTKLKIGLHETRLGDFFLIDERVMGASIDQEIGAFTINARLGTVNKSFARMGKFCANRHLYGLIKLINQLPIQCNHAEIVRQRENVPLHNDASRGANEGQESLLPFEPSGYRLLINDIRKNSFYFSPTYAG